MLEKEYKIEKIQEEIKDLNIDIYEFEAEVRDKESKVWGLKDKLR